jgi:hypothetical protein
MRYKEVAKFLIEATEEDLIQLKQELANKIANLPIDEKTAKIVDKIKQLLQDVGAGGRVASLLQRVETIKDEDVQKATTKLAKIIASIDFSSTEITNLFQNWNSDKIINIRRLLKGGKFSTQDIIAGYGTNPAMTEFVDDLNSISAYGIGEGEFTLAVLSKKITGIGADQGAGDLIIGGRNVEVKTRSVGAARFADREVTTTPNYTGLVTEFTKKYNQVLRKAKIGLPASGMNMGHLTKLASILTPQQKPIYKNDIKTILKNIFPSLNITKIANAIISGDTGLALQTYSQANLDNYLNIKRSKGALDGVLFMDKTTSSFIYVRQASDLEGSGMRLHAETPYVIAFVKPDQYPYPQMYIK